jgi:hypothetical protein
MSKVSLTSQQLNKGKLWVNSVRRVEETKAPSSKDKGRFQHQEDYKKWLNLSSPNIEERALVARLIPLQSASPLIKKTRHS